MASQPEGVVAARGHAGRGNSSTLTTIGDGNHCRKASRRLYISREVNGRSQRVRLDDGPHGRCRRFGFRNQAALSRYDPASVADCCIREGPHRVSGCYAIITRKGEVYWLADTSVNIEPRAEALVEIALCTAHMARRFDGHTGRGIALLFQLWQRRSSDSREDA